MIRRLSATVAVVTSLLCATVATAPVATAAGTPNQVALVVDYPGGGRQTYCVSYRSGMTGADVLAVAGPTYGQGPYAGFVLKIDGQGTTPPTNNDYWAYWVTQNGSLVYSSTGVGSNRPAAGDVQAWHWNSSGNAESPSGGSYASICPNGYAAPVAPAPVPTAAAGGGATTGTGGGGTNGGAGARAGNGGAGAPATEGSAGPSGSPANTSTDPTATAPTATGSPTASTSTPGASPSGVTSSVAARDVAATTDTGSGSGGTVALLAVGIAVLGLGGTAVVVRRRRADEE